MTAPIHSRLPDERLDRLMAQILEERAEDVAAATLSPDAMAGRLALRLRPTQAAPMSLRAMALLAVLGLVIVGSAVAMLVGSLPPSPAAMPSTFECVADAPDFPEFESQILHPITVVDGTGLAEGCRRITYEAVMTIREAIGPNFPSSMTRASLEVSKANASGTALLVFWRQHSCDQAASVNLHQLKANRIGLEVAQEHLPGPNGGECTPGGWFGAVEITFSVPVPVRDVRDTIQRIEIPESAAGQPPVSYECAADAQDFPEFDDQQLHPISVIDQTGIATGCRRMTSAAATDIRETIGPPFPEPFTNMGVVRVSRANASGTALLVLWIIQDCDQAAEVNLRIVETGVSLQLDQRRSASCAPGTGLAAIEIALRQTYPPEGVQESIQRSAISGSP